MSLKTTRRGLLGLGVAAAVTGAFPKAAKAALAAMDCNNGEDGGARGSYGHFSAYTPLLFAADADISSSPKLVNVTATTTGSGQPIAYGYEVIFANSDPTKPVNSVTYTKADFSQPGKVTFSNPVVAEGAYLSDVSAAPAKLNGVDFDWGGNGKVKIHKDIREWESGAEEQINLRTGRCVASTGPNVALTPRR